MPPSLLHLDAVAEERIQEAIRRGEFDGLPGAGKPLVLDEDPLVPAELRIANRVLSNAGLVPIEVLERREIADLEASLASLRDDRARSRVIARLALLRLRLDPRRMVCLSRNALYERRIMEKLAGG
jgi:hypothetical protein